MQTTVQKAYAVLDNVAVGESPGQCYGGASNFWQKIPSTEIPYTRPVAAGAGLDHNGCPEYHHGSASDGGEEESTCGDTKNSLEDALVAVMWRHQSVQIVA